MGATSVTGVSGPGAVSGIQKGSEHMSLGVNKLIGPKITAAGVTTLATTTGVVQFPALAGVTTDYVVMLTATTSTHCYVSTGLAAVSSSGDWGFTITGGNAAVVNWAIVKTGVVGVNVPG